MKLDKIEGKPDDKVAWGSDIAAQMLRRFGIPFISLNPGASYRGFHDSLVNHLGNENPGIILCLHEDHSVAIAHGYAKATGEPMACVLHSNVGLLHGMMGIFNAWCDRAPMIMLGATGPVASEKRRPWIDWIHTSRDQGAYIRSIVKWDDQPTSPAALVESMVRGNMMTRSAPTAPVYVVLDAGFQETKLDKEPEWPDVKRFQPPKPPRPSKETLDEMVAILSNAKKPIILFGRGSRQDEFWQPRIRLAERLGACVFTDLKQGAMFPSDHPHHYTEPFNAIAKDARAVDVRGRRHPRARLDGSRRRAAPGQERRHGHREDHRLLARPEPAHRRQHGVPGAAAVRRVRGDDRRCDGRRAQRGARRRPQGSVEGQGCQPRRRMRTARSPWRSSPRRCGISSTIPRTSRSARSAAAGRSTSGRSRAACPISARTAAAVSARAPAFRSARRSRCITSSRTATRSRCWATATSAWARPRSGARSKHRIPLLVIVNNNRSYFNDELHQDHVAKDRGREPKNRWIGLRMEDPVPNIAKLAEAQGAVGIGPVTSQEDARAAIAKGVDVLKKGGVCVIDFHIEPPAERQANHGLGYRATGRP